MKRIIICSITLILSIAYGIRVYNVNSQKEYPITKKYTLNDEVFIDEDFFNSNSEDMNGYSVKVNNTKLLTADEVKKQFNINDDETFSLYDHIFLVNVTFGNHGNNNGEISGIDIGNYILQNNGFINIAERDAYSVFNDNKPMKFSLEKGTYYDLTIPFGINERFIDIDDLCNGETQLVVSLYPNKKVINLVIT